MSELAPPIYVRLGGNPKLSALGRLLALAIAVMSLGVLITAARIVPSPTGVGTHTQLGLAPCGFLQQTGIPCAGCGMTTSFAYFVRGQLISSFLTQPFGMILAALTAATFWAGLYVGVTGKPSYRLLNTIPMKVHVFLWPGLALFGWAWKIIAVVSQHH